jgi:hypothetical protein
VGRYVAQVVRVQLKFLALTSLVLLTTSCSSLQSETCSEAVALEKGTRLIYEKYPYFINDPNPIKILQFDDIWYVSGTLPKGVAGGTPVVTLNHKSCELERIYHTQ